MSAARNIDQRSSLSSMVVYSFLFLRVLGPRVEWVEAVVRFLVAIIACKCGSNLKARGLKQTRLRNRSCSPPSPRSDVASMKQMRLVPDTEDRMKLVRNEYTTRSFHCPVTSRVPFTIFSGFPSACSARTKIPKLQPKQ